MMERVRIRTTFETEGILAYPDANASRGRILVNCPHPLLGGTLDNPVVMAILDGCVRAGFAALAWEYRTRTGLSQEEVDAMRTRFWEDHRLIESSAGDLADAQEIAGWFRKETLGCDEEITAYAGYSYGAIVSLLLADESPVFAISPPLRAMPQSARVVPQTRIILAEEDFAVSDEELVASTGLTRESDNVLTLDGSDHLFVGDAPRIADVAQEWALRLHSASSSDCHASSLL
ncbi:hypothetical protein KQI84_04300 [bacterium]|nr:hypothetical protein [bacterium]